MQETKKAEVSSATLPFAAKVALAAFAFSGASALIFEVAWIRSLSLVLGSTTYAVSTMLSAFMAGLALGSYAGGRLGDRHPNPALLFGLCELGIGIFGLLTVPMINSLPPVYFAIYKRYSVAPDVFFIAQFAVCFAIMLVPTALMGATFPVVTKIVAGKMDNVASDVGKVYSVNTIGAIIGSFSAGFILIPIVGIKATTQIAACLNLLVALAALVTSGSGRASLLGGGGIALLLAANLLAARTEQNAYYYNFYIAGRYDDFDVFRENTQYLKLLFSKDDPHGTVKVFRDTKTNTLSLQNGGKNEGDTGLDFDNTALLAYLPLAAKPDARSFLGIGLGTAITLRAAAGRVADVDWVEINPAVIRAVRDYFFPGLLASGVRIIVDDARTYLNVTDKKYDIISSEPSYPTESVTANLFTKEFFTAAARRLNPDGVFCQWMPYYLFSNREVEITLKTFTSVFPHASLWRVKTDLILIGSRVPFREEPSALARRIETLNQFPSPLNFNLSRDSGQITEIVGNSARLPVNTDDRPVLEFAAARAMLAGGE